ncbi:MAG: O-antigen ligase family protein [Planctomycetota bacterium]
MTDAALPRRPDSVGQSLGTAVSGSDPIIRSGSPRDRSRSRADALLSLPLIPIACGLTLLAAALVNPLDVEFRNSGEVDSVGLDWQVALKLVVSAIAGIVGLLGFVTSERVRHALSTLPGAGLVALGCVVLATSAVALDEVANVCRAAAIIYCIFVLFIPTAIAVLKLRTIVLMILAGLTMHMVVSWILYIFVPSIGVFEEELAGSTFVPRMSGTAHPNSVGRVGVLSIVICLALLRAYKLPELSSRGKWIVRGLVLLGIITAIQTMSRTAMAAGVASAIVMQWDRLLTRTGALIGLIAVPVVLAGFLVIGLSSHSDRIDDVVVSMGTKTGDATELTSATGRTVIWEVAIGLIQERPWTGWGLNSAPILLSEFSQHTHNLVLHVFFSGGIIAGGIAIILVLWTGIVGLLSREPLVRGVCAYVLVSGCFEDTVMETFPFSSTLLWFIALLAPVMYSDALMGESSSADDPGPTNECEPRSTSDSIQESGSMGSRDHGVSVHQPESTATGSIPIRASVPGWN